MFECFVVLMFSSQNHERLASCMKLSLTDFDNRLGLYLGLDLDMATLIET